MVLNKNNEFIPVRLVTNWHVCMNYRKLNTWTEKDHFTISFMDQMLDHPASRG